MAWFQIPKFTFWKSKSKWKCRKENFLSLIWIQEKPKKNKQYHKKCPNKGLRRSGKPLQNINKNFTFFVSTAIAKVLADQHRFDSRANPFDQVFVLRQNYSGFEIFLVYFQKKNWQCKHLLFDTVSFFFSKNIKF